MEIVIVCFGTGEVTGDSLAPMVGTALKEKYNIKTFVYGDLNDDINAKKIDSTLDMTFRPSGQRGNCRGRMRRKKRGRGQNRSKRGRSSESRTRQNGKRLWRYRHSRYSSAS